MTSINTPQGFVRALKASSDPPTPGGLLKIEIARQTWGDSSFHVPNKAEVVVEWILGKLLKEKDKELSLNPLLDLRCWTLLHDILSCPNIVELGTHTRPLRAWLPPLLGRIPFAPSFSALLRLLGEMDVESRRLLSPTVFSCLTVVWPVSVQKLSAENVLDCFGSFLSACCAIKEAEPDFIRMGSLLAASYRNSLLNSSNKKKVYLVFLQNVLPRWLELVTRPDTLSGTIYDAGVETLFNLDVLRRARDARTENDLFQAMAPILTSETELYRVLPRLFASFVSSIKRHRGALAVQSSTQSQESSNTDIQTQGMQFFASCLSLLATYDNAKQTWSATVGLLKVVDSESLFHHNDEFPSLLERIIGRALSVFDSKESATLAVYAIECLSTIMRIDYDMVVSLLPRILPKFFLISDSNVLYQQFLDLVIEYHSKTRTMHSYTSSIIDALSTASLHYSPSDIYMSAFSSPLLAPAHLQRLSTALRTYLSQTQIFSHSKDTFAFLTGEWDKFDTMESDTQKRPTKRRKSLGTGHEILANSEGRSAVVFSIASYLAMTVFSSLPIHAVTKDAQNELFELLSEVRSFAYRIVKKSMKTLKKCDDKWPISIIAVASFRLWYALDVSTHLPTAQNDDERLCKRVLEAIEDKQILPELFVELSRFLFHTSLHRELSAAQAAFEHSLLYLEQNLSVSSSDVSWSGQIHSLTHAKREQCALALLHMIVERWLPVVESFASVEQLGRFTRTIMSIGSISTTEQQPTAIQAQTLLLQTLHSAQFWELSNIRVAFLNHINQAISEPDLGIEEPSISLQTVAAGYGLLSMLPVEYLARSSRAEFTRRALALDSQIPTSAAPSASRCECLLILRTFLTRIFSNGNGSDLSVEHLCEFLEHLMSPVMPPELDENFDTVTMRLAECIILELFKKSEKTSSDAVLHLLRSFAQIDIQVMHQPLDVRARGFNRAIDVLERHFKLISFPDNLQSTLLELHQTLSQSIYPRISTFEFAVVSAQSATACINLMTLWRSLLCFRRWLGVSDEFSPLASQLLSKLLTGGNYSNDRDETRVAVVATLLEEFYFCPQKDRSTSLDYLFATYASTYRLLQHSARHRANASLAKACNNFSATEFVQLLNLITEYLERDGSSEMRVYLLQISSIILHNHPRGTLKQIQKFTTRYIQAFLSWSDLLDGPIELRIQTLEFVVQYCTEQPAALRVIDLGSIWTLLTLFLASSRVHDDHSTLEIFHKIVSVVSALVRLRRDLVIHTLPHVGSILRQLLATVRTIRPNLGSKQVSLVADTLPRWLNANHPVGLEEVKVLARLLETFTVKSLVRNNVSNLETHKAESLAKPFSKHAAHVLKAYIAVMNDPLCLLPSEHRKELQPGLFALCSMISDHSRDALMVGALDSGGKITMKSLWKEYEKQRYIGKG